MLCCKQAETKCRLLTTDYPAALKPAKEEHEHCGAVDNVKYEQEIRLCISPRNVPAQHHPDTAGTLCDTNMLAGSA